MTSAARIEANRKNAQRSTGPRTEEGKDRSRFNALKDGASARSPVIPGEDAAEFQHRIDTWTASLNPTNEVEAYLVEHAARASWQLDRIDRAHAARIASSIRNTDADALHEREREVAALGRRLFHDARGPIQAYPHFEYKPGQIRVSSNGLADDPDHPCNLVHQLESTESGCQWLLARWSQLKKLLDDGLAWQPPDKLKVMRLLGHQPLDAIDNLEVAEIYLACHALDSRNRNPFIDLWSELTPGEQSICGSHIDARHFKLFPRETKRNDTARVWLVDMVSRTTTRLQNLAAAHQARLQADAAEVADRLAFDDSKAGDRLRRFHATNSRALLRSLDLLRKLRQPPAESQSVATPPIPDLTHKTIPKTPHQIEPNTIPKPAETPKNQYQPHPRALPDLALSNTAASNRQVMTLPHPGSKLPATPQDHAEGSKAGSTTGSTTAPVCSSHDRRAENETTVVEAAHRLTVGRTSCRP